MEDIKTGEPGRRVYLDALRILACLAVIYNHVAGGSMRLFEGAFGAAALLLFFASKCAVPLFLLISGAVLLGRVDSYKKTALRILRIFLALVLATLLYYGANCLKEGRAFEAAAFLRTLVRGQAAGSLWYLYLYLGALVALPLLQRLSLRMTPGDHRWFAAWSLLFTAVAPAVAAMWPALRLNSSFQLALFTTPMGLVMLGYYLDSQRTATRRQALGALLAGAILIAIPTLATIKQPELFGMWDNYDLPTATGPAVCAFIAGKWLLGRRTYPQGIQKAVTGLGRQVFCTYLISDLLVERLAFVREGLVPTLRVNGAGLVYVLVVFTAGMAIAWALTKAPGLKRIL